MRVKAQQRPSCYLRGNWHVFCLQPLRIATSLDCRLRKSSWLLFFMFLPPRLDPSALFTFFSITDCGPFVFIVSLVFYSPGDYLQSDVMCDDYFLSVCLQVFLACILFFTRFFSSLYSLYFISQTV